MGNSQFCQFEKPTSFFFFSFTYLCFIWACIYVSFLFKDCGFFFFFF